MRCHRAISRRLCLLLLHRIRSDYSTRDRLSIKKVSLFIMALTHEAMMDNSAYVRWPDDLTPITPDPKWTQFKHKPLHMRIGVAVS